MLAVFTKKISLKKRDIFLYYIVICYLFFTRFFFLIDENFGFAGFKLEDIFLIVFFLINIGIILCKPKPKIKTNFGFFVALAFITSIFSSFSGMNYFKQSFFEGLRPLRYFIVILFSYYSFPRLFPDQDISIEKIQKAIVILGMFECCLYILQSLLIPNIVFLHLVTSKKTIGPFSRLYCDSSGILLMILISVNKMIKEKKTKFLLPIILGFIHIIFVSQGRLELFSIIISCVTMVLIFYRRKIEFYLFLLFICFIVILLINNDYVSNIFKTFLEGGDTMSIRESAHSFYLNALTSSPINFIFGCGFPNTSVNSAAEISGYSTYHYIIADNGIFAYFYILGLLGLINIIGLVLKYISTLSKIKVGRDNIIWILGFLVFNIVGGYNLCFWFLKEDWTLFLVICLIILDQMKQKNKKGKNYEKIGKTAVS